jgi:hypothetical protein
LLLDQQISGLNTGELDIPSFIGYSYLGGMVWESEEQCASIDDALAAADRAIVEKRA